MYSLCVLKFSSKYAKKKVLKKANDLKLSVDIDSSFLPWCYGKLCTKAKEREILILPFSSFIFFFFFFARMSEGVRDWRQREEGRRPLRMKKEGRRGKRRLGTKEKEDRDRAKMRSIKEERGRKEEGRKMGRSSRSLSFFFSSGVSLNSCLQGSFATLA